MLDFAAKDNPNSKHAEEHSPTPQERVKARKVNRNPNMFGGNSKQDYARLDMMDQETIDRMEKLEDAEENE